MRVRNNRRRPRILYILALFWFLSIFGPAAIIKVALLAAVSMIVLALIGASSANSSKGQNSQSNTAAGNTQTGAGNNAQPERVKGTELNQNDVKRQNAMSANPYSSTMRYSAGGNVQSGQGAKPQTKPEAKPEEVKLSARERKKIAKQAALEAELQRARAAEERKVNEELKAEKAKKDAEAAKRKAEASLSERYNVPKRKRTGDASIDKMLDDEEAAIATMRQLDDHIEDEKVSAQIVHLEEVTTKIVNFVIDHPDKKKEVRRFFGYYLPTSIKLLQAYDHADGTGISGENIDSSKEQVEAMMDKALESFDKQLDALYADVNMNIASEIKVMESMLAQEGFTDEIISTVQNGGK